jgi:Outer membrane protein beta-barrel domain
MKNFVQHTLAAALMLTVASAAQAQITFGPKVGLNLSNVKVKLSDASKSAGAKEEDTKMKVGASFGVMMNARFGNLSIQPALTYSMNGYKIDEDINETTTNNGVVVTQKGTATGSYSWGYVNVPINLIYTTGGDQGFQVFVGPYVGLNLGGKYDYESKVTSTTTVNGQQLASVSSNVSGKGDIEGKSKVSESDAQKDDVLYLRTLDYGVNAGIGYLVNNFQIQAGYSLGLANLVPDYDGDTTSDSDKDKAFNRVIQVTVGYHFGGK